MKYLAALGLGLVMAVLLLVVAGRLLFKRGASELEDYD